MRIVNNKIFIAKGETPTYSARIIDKDTGAPFIIDKSMALNQDGSARTIVIEFVVRDSAYSRDEDKRIRKDLLLFEGVSYYLFDDAVIKDYVGYHESIDENGIPVLNNTVKPQIGDEKRLHKYENNGDYFYYYYDGSKWVNYDFEFNATLTYEETNAMEPKTYKYEIALFAGNIKQNALQGEFPLDQVEYKKQLLPLTDFIVEGSISE